MRIVLAGATGVIGSRLLPLLIADGHQVAALTRTAAKAEQLRTLGADPIVCDVFDAPQLTAVVAASAPEMVIHQLTDLPDRLEQLAGYGARNDRMRTEGTRNLIDASQAAGAPRLLAQSIAWRPAGRGAAVQTHERQILDAGGLVIRYGQLYGPGTFYEDERPDHPRLHLDVAAVITRDLIEATPGVVVVAEDEHGQVAPTRLRAPAEPGEPL
jgi:nucleoside-diphosphate-sugar epimerase